MKYKISLSAMMLGLGLFAFAPAMSSGDFLGSTAAFAKGHKGDHSVTTHTGKHSDKGGSVDDGDDDDQGGVTDDDQGDDDQGDDTDDQGDDDQGDDSQ